MWMCLSTLAACVIIDLTDSLQVLFECRQTPATLILMHLLTNIQNVEIQHLSRDTSCFPFLFNRAKGY